MGPSNHGNCRDSNLKHPTPINAIAKVATKGLTRAARANWANEFVDMPRQSLPREVLGFHQFRKAAVSKCPN